MESGEMKHAWFFVFVVAASLSPAEAAQYLDDTVQGSVVHWISGSPFARSFESWRFRD